MTITTGFTSPLLWNTGLMEVFRILTLNLFQVNKASLWGLAAHLQYEHLSPQQAWTSWTGVITLLLLFSKMWSHSAKSSWKFSFRLFSSLESLYEFEKMKMFCSSGPHALQLWHTELVTSPQSYLDDKPARRLFLALFLAWGSGGLESQALRLAWTAEMAERCSDGTYLSI